MQAEGLTRGYVMTFFNLVSFMPLFRICQLLFQNEKMFNMILHV